VKNDVQIWIVMMVVNCLAIDTALLYHPVTYHVQHQPSHQELVYKFTHCLSMLFNDGVRDP